MKADKSDARIYIDGSLVGTGEAATKLSLGRDGYKVECDMHQTVEGSATVKEGEPTTVEVKLAPAFGFLKVTTSPEGGAIVSVDGKCVGELPVERLEVASGEHTVSVEKAMYRQADRACVMTDGGNVSLSLEMEPIFAETTVVAEGDDIYIDDEHKGRGRWTGRLQEGPHLVEAKNALHRDVQRRFDAVAGKSETVTPRSSGAYMRRG